VAGAVWVRCLVGALRLSFLYRRAHCHPGRAIRALFSWSADPRRANVASERVARSDRVSHGDRVSAAGTHWILACFLENRDEIRSPYSWSRLLTLGGGESLAVRDRV